MERYELVNDDRLPGRGIEILNRMMTRLRVSKSQRFDLRLAVDEALTNIVDHSGTAKAVYILLPGPGSLTITLIYNTLPFDTTPRQPGGERGYGLALMQTMVDKTTFRFLAHAVKVEMVKTW